MEQTKKKTCRSCKLEQPIASFGKIGKYLRSYCKSCTQQWIRKWERENPEKAKRSHKNYRTNNKLKRRETNQKWYVKNPDMARGSRLRKYWPGSTWKQALTNYNQLFLLQGGVCLFCKQEESAKDRYGGLKCLAVDHDHSTGKARSLLCHNCNMAFGSIKENVDAIQNMLEYAKKHQTTKDSETKDSKTEE